MHRGFRFHRAKVTFNESMSFTVVDCFKKHIAKITQNGLINHFAHDKYIKG
jgi:hypothetical protein